MKSFSVPNLDTGNSDIGNKLYGKKYIYSFGQEGKVIMNEEYV
jgi:hypothetical protein